MRHMMTAEQFWKPHLAVGDVAELLPEAGAKFVRNMTDRGLVGLAELPGGRPGLRLYSLKNVVELYVMHLVSTAGAPLPETKLIARAVTTRAELRIDHGTLGTGQDPQAMIYVIDAARERGMKRTVRTISATWRSPWDSMLSYELHSLWLKHPLAEIRMFPADAVIEDVMRRYEVWRRSEHERKDDETKAA